MFWALRDGASDQSSSKRSRNCHGNRMVTSQSGALGLVLGTVGGGLGAGGLAVELG
jgi:hypothetical protein